MRAGERRQSEKSGIFVPNRVHDLLRCSTQTGVNHFVSCVSKGAGHHLRTTVVAVEPGFGNDDAQGLFHERPTGLLL